MVGRRGPQDRRRLGRPGSPTAPPCREALETIWRERGVERGTMDAVPARSSFTGLQSYCRSNTLFVYFFYRPTPFAPCLQPSSGRWDVVDVAQVTGPHSGCNLTSLGGGWQKIVAQIRGVFRKMITHYPPGGRILAQNQVFTPIFRLHTVTTGSGDRLYGYFLRLFHVLIEIYPLVPFPPSVHKGFSVYTSRVSGWGPMTPAGPAPS